MKNRVLLSIVDENGNSKQYNIHKFAKKIFYSILFVLLLTLVLGFFLMHYFMQKVQEISIKKSEMIENYRKVHEQNADLRERITNKSLELIDVSRKVGDLEEIVDIRKNNDTIEQVSVDLKQIDLGKKTILLQIIPNGNPVKTWAQIIPSEKRIHPLKGIYGVKSGVDYLVPLRTPVYATADGIVDLVRNGRGGYGRLIKIAHAYGFSSMYGHLDEMHVKKGDFVKKGQLIGYSGRSGNSAGERLYYEVRFLGAHQDAWGYIHWGESNFESIFSVSEQVDWNRLFWALDDLKQLRDYRNTYLGE